MEARFKAVPAMSQPAANGMSIDVAILGARMHYAIPRILARRDLLGTLYTDAYLGNKPWLRALLERGSTDKMPLPLRKFLTRNAPELEGRRVVSFDLLGIKANWSMRRIRSHAQLLQFHAKTARTFCERVAGKGFSGADAVYALNGASLEIFREAKNRGISCILEQTVAPARILRRLLAEEAERWPGGQSDLVEDYSSNPIAAREEGEWPLADCVICGSGFVAAGLQSLGIDKSKCRVVPYGIDTTAFQPREGRGTARGLNVLFVGAVGLRKGVPYLFEALRKLDSPLLRCRAVGRVEVEPRWLARHQGTAETLGAVPRSDIIRMYEWADVFVLPSICEGSATVTYEALACGLPVITTPNAGSVVRDDQEGFVVPIRDSDAIAACLQRLLDDRELVRTMSANARKRSLEFGLESYGRRIINLITGVVDGKLKARTKASSPEHSS